MLIQNNTPQIIISVHFVFLYLNLLTRSYHYLKQETIYLSLIKVSVSIVLHCYIVTKNRCICFYYLLYFLSDSGNHCCGTVFALLTAKFTLKTKKNQNKIMKVQHSQLEVVLKNIKLYYKKNAFKWKVTFICYCNDYNLSNRLELMKKVSYSVQS